MKPLLKLLQARNDQFKGEVDPRFLDVAQLFSRFQDSRANEGGASVVVFFQGKKVLDIYIGKKSASEDWQNDTMSMCYSTGKGVLATLAHILVSEGHVAYDEPVATYWPEFAQNGKNNITLRQMLSHQTGLFDIRHLIDDANEMLDWAHMLKKIEEAQPKFEPCTDAAYQPLTFGWQVAGVLEKATGKSLHDLMQTYLVEALQLDGAYFGIDDQALSRVAVPFFRSSKKKQNQTTKQKQAKRKPSFFEKMVELSGQNLQEFQDAMIPKGMKNFSFFDEAGLKAVIPAANGVFTAHSLAKIYAMLANKGTWQGKQLISDQVFQELSQIQYTFRDRIMPLPMHWRLGYHRILHLGKSTQGFGHMGFNGSGAWCDPARDLSFAYTHNFATNSITGDYRLWALSQEVLRCADRALTGRKGWF